MANVVTIQGTQTPCVELATGVQWTGTPTDHIRRLVARGYAIVVAGSLAAALAEDVIGEPAEGETGDAAEVVTGDGATHTGELPVDPPPFKPHNNASRAEWAAYVRAKGIAFPDDRDAYDAGDKTAWAGRDDLIIIDQQASGGS